MFADGHGLGFLGGVLGEFGFELLDVPRGSELRCGSLELQSGVATVVVGVIIESSLMVNVQRTQYLECLI